jgi:hypothetical protein
LVTQLGEDLKQEFVASKKYDLVSSQAEADVHFAIVGIDIAISAPVTISVWASWCHSYESGLHENSTLASSATVATANHFDGSGRLYVQSEPS